MHTQHLNTFFPMDSAKWYTYFIYDENGQFPKTSVLIDKHC